MKCDAFTSTASPGCTRPSNSPSTSATLCARTIFPGSIAGARGAVGNALRQLSHADERVERQRRRRLADALVAGGRKVASFAHVAEHGDARAGDLERAERGQRGPHGVGVRVVGVVHHDEPPAGMQQFLAPGLGQRALEGARDGGEVHAGRQADGGGRARVRHVVQAAQAERARLPQDGKVFRRVGAASLRRSRGRRARSGPAPVRPAPRGFGPHGGTVAPAGLGPGLRCVGPRPVEAHDLVAPPFEPGAGQKEVRPVVGAVQKRHARRLGQRAQSFGLGARDVVAASQESRYGFRPHW